MQKRHYTSICAVQTYDGAIKAGKHRVGLGGDCSVMPDVPEEFSRMLKSSPI